MLIRFFSAIFVGLFITMRHIYVLVSHLSLAVYERFARKAAIFRNGIPPHRGVSHFLVSFSAPAGLVCQCRHLVSRASLFLSCKRALPLFSSENFHDLLWSREVFLQFLEGQLTIWPKQRGEKSDKQLLQYKEFIRTKFYAKV